MGNIKKEKSLFSYILSEICFFIAKNKMRFLPKLATDIRNMYTYPWEKFHIFLKLQKHKFQNVQIQRAVELGCCNPSLMWLGVLQALTKSAYQQLVFTALLLIFIECITSDLENLHASSVQYRISYILTICCYSCQIVYIK